jgi:hypothetical protein
MDDAAVRAAIYARVMSSGVVPSAAELAPALEGSVADVRASFARLAEAHVLVLQSGNEEILMAAPFSAVPTSFLVTAGDFKAFANCIWDALGVLATLHRDGEVRTACACCGTAMTIVVSQGELAQRDGVVHFAVPAAKWWDNIVFT